MGIYFQVSRITYKLSVHRLNLEKCGFQGQIISYAFYPPDPSDISISSLRWLISTRILKIFRQWVLKGHCNRFLCIVVKTTHSKCLTKNLFSNIAFLLEHWEETIKWFLWERTNYNQFLGISLKCTGETWKYWPIFSSCNSFPPKPSAAKKY